MYVHTRAVYYTVGGSYARTLFRRRNRNNIFELSDETVIGVNESEGADDG